MNAQNVTPCLDEETILGFCAGGLSSDARAVAEEHIGTCDECRALVSAVARADVAVRAPDDADDRDDDRAPGPLLRARIDLGMAATTPIAFGAGGRGAGFAGPAASPVQPGQILAGKFEVERVLGAGGMGIVVAARHTQLDQRVALKFLLPIACEVPGAVARFLREGKAAARITSEHVARVKDTGVLEGGAPYLVMEYLEGSDLGALVQARGRIPAEEAIDFVLQACEAIVEAHELGIVHRDLKPANLFLSHRADGSPLVKVLDFGISKIEGGGSRSELLTSASVLMGSPRYMSPEQMLSAKDVDARADVWALGVILYELVTGKPVWHADTVQGLCALIASAPAPSLSVLSPDAPPLLDEVVARCLTKSRDARLASVADLALALEPIAPASARTSIERILRVARKDRGRLAAGAAASSPPQPATLAPPPAAAPRAGRVGTVLAIAVGVLLLAGIAINAALAERSAPLGGGAPLVSAAPSPATPLAASGAASVTAETAAAASASAPIASAAPARATPAAAAPAASAPPLSSPATSLPRRALGVTPVKAPASAAPTSSSGGAPESSTAPASPVAMPQAAQSSRALTDRK